MYNVPIPPIEIRMGDATKKLINDTDVYAYLNNVANNSPSTSRWSNGYKNNEKVPASEWNWTFGQMTRLMFRMRKDLYSSCHEIMNAIKTQFPTSGFDDTADIDMSRNDTNHQLADTINTAIYRDRQVIAGEQTDNPSEYKSPLGSVATSDASGKVSVDPDTGVMTVNGMGDVAGVGSIVNPNALTSLTAILANLINVIYPVGTIYTSTTLSTPEQVAAKFGGIWEAYGQGRVLVGAGQATVNNVTRSFTAGATGGYYLINLTAAQLAPHYHGRGTQEITASWTASESGAFHNKDAYADGAAYVRGDYKYKGADGSADHSPWFGFAASRSWSGRTDGGYVYQDANNWTACSSAGHENTQPYVVVYMYRRTA